MSNLALTLNLLGFAKPLAGTMTPTEGPSSSNVGADSAFMPFRRLMAATEAGESSFVAMVQAMLANGNAFPGSGRDLPPEAVALSGRWFGEWEGELAGVTEASLSATIQRGLEGRPVPTALAAKLDLAPFAQAFEPLQSPKAMLALPEQMVATRWGPDAADLSPPLLASTNQFVPQFRSTDAPAVTRPPLLLDVPLGHEKWVEALGERVNLMLRGDQQVARLRLDPPHLGPLELRVALNQDQASVALVAQHALVREALEQAIPRLRELLGQQDLQLVDVDVSQGELADGHGRSKTGGDPPTPRQGAPEHRGGSDTLTERPVEIRAGRQLVDLFA